MFGSVGFIIEQNHTDCDYKTLQIKKLIFFKICPTCEYDSI